MGMYDDIEVLIPLPDLPKGIKPEFQTKSLDCELDRYRIEKDGTLLHEDYTIEDRSDPNAEGLLRFKGMLTRIPTGWSKVPLTGEIRFYTWDHTREQLIEYVVFYANGELESGPWRARDD